MKKEVQGMEFSLFRNLSGGWVEGIYERASQVTQMVKNPPANTGDTSLIPGSGRSPGGGNGNLIQYSCLGSCMDRGVWWATVHGIAKSWTWLSNWARTYAQVSATPLYFQQRRIPESGKFSINTDWMNQQVDRGWIGDGGWRIDR